MVQHALAVVALAWKKTAPQDFSGWSDLLIRFLWEVEKDATALHKHPAPEEGSIARELAR